MADRKLTTHYCLGANAELQTPAPISLATTERGIARIVCPFYASEKCLAKVTKRDELDVVKDQVNRHSNSPQANSYPRCIYASEGINLV
jgi:hypothetical protein